MSKSTFTLTGAITCTLLLSAACVDAEQSSDDASLQSQEPLDTTMLVHIYYETPERLAQLSEEIDLLEHADRVEGYVAALIEADEFERLTAEGLEIVIQDQPTSLLRQMLGGGGFRSIPNFACYRTVEETAGTMATLAAEHPELVEIVDIGDSWDKVTPGGADGYDLQVAVLTNQSIVGPKPRFFLMGSIHAREYATAELAIRFAEQLVAGYGTDPEATFLLDNYELHVLPHVNPDGRKIAEQGFTQRKNRNTSAGACSYPPTSSSQHGVDLNRAHSFKWGGAGTSTSACNLTYRGTAAANQPETQALESYVTSLFPDQRGPNDNDAAPDDTTGLLISLHSYSPLVLYPWSWGAQEAPNLEQLRTLGRKFGYHNHYPVCQGPLCLYAASGTTDDWAYGALGIAGYTFEVGTSFFQDCASFDATIAPDNLEALWTAFKAARRPYQTPSGPDAINLSVSASPVTAGTSVSLSATLDDTRFASNGWGDEPVQAIAAARYSVDQPAWAGAPQTSMAADDASFDTSAELATATIDTTGWLPGRYTILVEGRDADGNWGAPSAVFLDVEAGSGEVCGDAIDNDDDTLVDCADADCLTTPACAQVEVCDDLVDDDGDDDLDCADADCLDAPECAPPVEVCDDMLDNDGDTLVDCDDADCSDEPVCWTVINSTDFEAGWGFYVDGGADAARVNNVTYAHGGTWTAQLRDNSGAASAIASTAFNLSGASKLEIDLWYYPLGMEVGEDFYVELYDGNVWQVVGNFASGTHFSNGAPYHQVITVSSGSVNFSAAASVRIRCDASADNDAIYVDDVKLSIQ